MLNALTRLRQPPSAEQLITRARRRAGLTDFGDVPFERPLQMFLSVCREQADLSLFGGAAICWDTVRFLSNLLRLNEEEKRAPEILGQPVDRPLVIAGLPRSGTTFLHSLLAEDRANFVPRVWQLIHPYPAHRSGAGSDRRQRQVARQLRLFQLLAPQFRRLHPIKADSPQECSEITAHLFASLRFDTTYRIPALSALARRYRASRRLSLSQALLAAPPASGGWSGALGTEMPRPYLRARRYPHGLSRCRSSVGTS